MEHPNLKNNSLHIVIFGGSGFIGRHLAIFLLRKKLCRQITLVDYRHPEFLKKEKQRHILEEAIRENIIHCVGHDIRLPCCSGKLPARADLIVNLAAPPQNERLNPKACFENHILGSENICAYADYTGCQHIIFTSTTDVYDTTGGTKSEASPTHPTTPLANSKLKAEEIFCRWQAGKPGNKVVIARAAEIFGSDGYDRVSQMLKTLKWHCFFYLSNKEVKKAVIYVEEFCMALWWICEKQIAGNFPQVIFNITPEISPSMQHIVSAIQQALPGKHHRTPLNLPYKLWAKVAGKLNCMAELCCMQPPFNLNHISAHFASDTFTPEWLLANKYPWSYTLESSFLDWHEKYPSDFSYFSRAGTQKHNE